VTREHPAGGEDQASLLSPPAPFSLPSTRPGGIRRHLLQVLDVDLAHFELGDKNASHDGIAMLRFLSQFSLPNSPA